MDEKSAQQRAERLVTTFKGRHYPIMNPWKTENLTKLIAAELLAVQDEIYKDEQAIAQRMVKVMMYTPVDIIEERRNASD